MRHTVVGILCDEIGAAYDPMQRTRLWTTPAGEIRREQADWIPVDREHDHQWVGQVVHLERHAGRLWCVVEVDAEPFVSVRVGDEIVRVSAPHYWSAERVSTPDDRDVILRSMALTTSPARIAAQPLLWFDGGLDDRGSWLLDKRRLDGHLGGLVTRAAETRHRSGPLIVHDDQPLHPGARADRPLASGLMLRDDQPGGLWHRMAERVDVHPSHRLIELVVLPYEVAAPVLWQGKMVEEVIARGAFDGIERDAARVRVNRDHKLERTVGRAIALHPRRREGLVAEVKIARTPLGDETLTLAAEGILDASAGFRPNPGGQQWQGRDRYRVTSAYLGHIALTPDPAYVDARVLAVT